MCVGCKFSPFAFWPQILSNTKTRWGIPKIEKFSFNYGLSILHSQFTFSGKMRSGRIFEEGGGQAHQVQGPCHTARWAVLLVFLGCSVISRGLVRRGAQQVGLCFSSRSAQDWGEHRRVPFAGSHGQDDLCCCYRWRDMFAEGSAGQGY